jgi:hypothetical protein
VLLVLGLYRNLVRFWKLDIIVRRSIKNIIEIRGIEIQLNILDRDDSIQIFVTFDFHKINEKTDSPPIFTTGIHLHQHMVGFPRLRIASLLVQFNRIRTLLFVYVPSSAIDSSGLQPDHNIDSDDKCGVVECFRIGDGVTAVWLAHGLAGA